MRGKRKVIIGLDGVPHRLIKELSESGVMENVGSLIREGTFRSMNSSIPEVSSVAWSSIITGTNPAQHGIFGFTDLRPGTYRLYFPNFKDLKATPFWRREDSGRSVIINVPSTYPALSLNGVLIAGFVALDLQKAVYPGSLVPFLENMGYRVDVDSQKAHLSIDLFLKDLKRTFNARVAAYRYFWDNEEWDTFVLVFTGTDRISHFLWDAYEDKSHKRHLAFLDYFREIDEVIGEIVSKMEEKDILVMLSDHGFELLEKDVQVNRFLKERGFLRFSSDNPKNIGDIDPSTKAFALDPGRIYINLEDRYPRGSVKPEDKEVVIQELTEAFNSLEFEGRRVIKHVYRKEEIYEGPFMDRAPDLVLLGNKGFNLRAGIRAKRLFNKGVFTGKHSQGDAFLLTKNPSDNIISPDFGVSDVVGLMDALSNTRG